MPNIGEREPRTDHDRHQADAERTPFDSIESAHEYVALLIKQVEAVKAGLAEDVNDAASATAARRLDALRLVDYKLAQLGDHLAASGRVLNDLRALRRLLLGERGEAPETRT